MNPLRMSKVLPVFCCVAALLTAATVPAHADCKDEIQAVRDDMEQNKKDYTADAMIEARKHLVQADIPSLKLADCRREVAAAKKELRQGKK
jgi:hypothetical protein